MTTFCEDNFIACFKSTNMSQMFMQLLLALVWGLAVMMLLGDAQRSDFISIDCGLRQDFSYTDGLTTITYIPDTDFIDTGERKSISSDYIDEFSQPFRSLRSFPEGTRNCYKMNINSGQKYLIRASFVYGNYDGQNNLPEFELHLGASLWESVVILMPYKRIVKELIHIPMQNYIQICMVNIGKGAPFISVIELRRLHNEIYQTEVRSLALLFRRSLKMNETGYRYPDDVNDRIWITEFFDDLKELNTSSVIDPDQTAYQLPSAVMSSAATPGDNSTKYLEISWQGETKGVCYMYMHFAEVQDRNSSSSRELTITINGDIINYTPLEPQYLSTTTINATIAAEQGPYYNISLVISTPAAKMDQPFLNAYELYMAKDFLVPETNQQDIEAITKLKSSYKIIKNWQGDPCNPQKYVWEGVKCSYSDHDSSRIISLDLSSSGLSGEIADSIANLTVIETLDLSNNNLSGQIPEYFSQLRKLHILNLEQNELTGLVPGGLSAKTGDGLSLSLCGNPSLSPHVPCEKKKNTSRPVVIIVVVPIVGLLFVIIFTGAIVWKCQQKRKQQNHGTYDVFLSFRGEDTRNTIISYLRDALIREKINPFLDQDNLKIGAEIKPSLVSAIQASKMAIIIFSETYVSSAWCLNELVTILECKQHRQLVVFPFFYKVAPTDVRHQSQHFLLDESIYHDQEHKDMFPQWRKALTEVANLAGKTYNNDGSEATMIDDIVKETLKIVGKQQE